MLSFFDKPNKDSQNSLTARNIYLSDSEHPPYGDKK